MRIIVIDPWSKQQVEYLWLKPDRWEDHRKYYAIEEAIIHAYSHWEGGWEGETWDELRDRILWEFIFAQSPKKGNDISSLPTIVVDCTTELFYSKIDLRLAVMKSVVDKIDLEMKQWMIKMVDPITDEKVVVAFGDKMTEEEQDHLLGVQMARAAVKWAKQTGAKFPIDETVWLQIRDSYLHSINAKIVDKKISKLRILKWTLRELINFNNIVDSMIHEITKEEVKED